MGRVIMSGIVPTLKAPVTGVKAGTLAVGSIVKLMEGGAAVEYLVVNQGIPSNSNLYDSSCNGTWLLRKDIHSNRQWNTSDENIYETSAINTWLNGDFFNLFGTVERATIKTVKIPYRKDGGFGGTDQSGADGLVCKVFLLGGYELGWTAFDVQYFPKDGAKLSYFESGDGTSATNKRIAKLNGSTANWWLRSQYTRYTYDVWGVSSVGYNYSGNLASNSYGIRPALILPSNALFDEATKLLKGVK